MTVSKKRYIIYLPPDLHRAIKVRAAETGMSISGLIEEWARAGLQDRPLRDELAQHRVEVNRRGYAMLHCEGDCGAVYDAAVRDDMVFVVGGPSDPEG